MQDNIGDTHSAAMERILGVDTSVRMVRQEVLERLRAAIMMGHLEPGQRLIERELCDWTGVSRTSVREAIRQLESEGLIVHVPRKGPAVGEISVEEAMEMFEVRSLLEPAMIALFIENATDADIDRMTDAVGRLRMAVERSDSDGILSAKSAFYETALIGCGNKVLAGFIRSLQVRLVLLRSAYLRQPERWGESLKELEAVVETVRRRDVEAGRAAFALHIERARQAAVEGLSPDTQPN